MVSRMNQFKQLFGGAPFAVIGMIHVNALPGTPKYTGPIQQLIDMACHDALIYKKSGVHGVLLENMHDIPYQRASDLSPETVAVMTRVCSEVRKMLPGHTPCGVQILAGGNKEALATAKAADLQFIRCEGFVFSHIADEGFIDACAGELLRYRKYIDAEDIQIYTDIKKKHSAHTLTSDVSISETAQSAEFFLSDALIVTGNATGHPANSSEVKVVKESATLPVLVGSGVSKGNIEKYLNYADGAIIGSQFKYGCKWQNSVSEDHVLAFMEKMDELKQNVQERSK